ncbi:leucine--tRNA ligase [Opitutales bacterium ASA1]|uniref:leucine--tRNA ligase n=1 Tax=Congregicoccus parvus TaxID=3081749 RepID=UPI002B2CB69D|nr:leucine--tRNA ligase [Opitutales bacterium ASA1]
MATSGPDYDFRTIEAAWQKFWDDNSTFQAAAPSEQPKYYVLDMFPYPSGAGLHVGHPLGYVATDIYARFKRARGFNVLHTMGFDAFGLPAEQYAIETGVHPAVSTERNIASMRRQLYRLGLAHDKTRSVSTTDVAFYRWTQWIFLQIFNACFDPFESKARPIADLERDLVEGRYRADFQNSKLVQAPDRFRSATIWRSAAESDRKRFLDSQRLAYVSEVPVNWCPALGTVLANEEVTADGRSERGNHPVFKRPLRQWMLRITTYTERLLADLALVDWPEPIKLMQRNWIGRSEGAEIVFDIDGLAGETLRVYTTRPDTLFGATYMVLAPEHPLVDRLTTEDRRSAVQRYVQASAARSEVQRAEDGDKDKTGEFTGSYAINPVNQERIPIWIADYVLMGYGTGAIMAVPAHDERDFTFARKFDLPIRRVVAKDATGTDEPVTAATPDEGVLVDSGEFSGLPSAEGRKAITAALEARGRGRTAVQFKLRDWLFSRQRYWGEPFPIVHGDNGEIVALEDTDLPVELPPIDDFSPQSYDDPNTPPMPPLSRASETWRMVERGGRTYHRELNTMPQWAGSCWYYLRYVDPTNDTAFVAPDLERYWMGPNGVDLYVGGAEHAVLHLLYARFWHKVLFDLGHVSTPEPFGKLFNQGYIQAAAYTDERGVYVPAAEIEERDGGFYHRGRPVSRQFGKMGKSLKNSVTPDDVCAEYGADTLRLYLMFLGPLEAMKPWSSHGIEGVHRFLRKIWRECVGEDGGRAAKISDAPESSPDTLRVLHETIKKVTEDLDALRFNTAISQMMILCNHLQKVDTVGLDTMRTLVQLVAPFAPHMAEELWVRLGGGPSVAYAPWPKFDPARIVCATVKLVVQVNGKMRGDVAIAPDAPESEALALAQVNEKIAPHLEGKSIRKVVYVPGRILNLVVG